MSPVEFRKAFVSSEETNNQVRKLEERAQAFAQSGYNEQAKLLRQQGGELIEGEYRQAIARGEYAHASISVSRNKNGHQVVDVQAQAGNTSVLPRSFRVDHRSAEARTAIGRDSEIERKIANAIAEERNTVFQVVGNALAKFFGVAKTSNTVSLHEMYGQRDQALEEYQDYINDQAELIRRERTDGVKPAEDLSQEKLAQAKSLEEKAFKRQQDNENAVHGRVKRDIKGDRYVITIEDEEITAWRTDSD